MKNVLLGVTFGAVILGLVTGYLLNEKYILRSPIRKTVPCGIDCGFGGLPSKLDASEYKVGFPFVYSTYTRESRDYALTINTSEGTLKTTEYKKIEDLDKIYEPRNHNTLTYVANYIIILVIYLVISLGIFFSFNKAI